MVFVEGPDLDMIVDRSKLAEGLADHDIFVIDAGLVLVQQVVVVGPVLVHEAIVVGGLVPWASCVDDHETFGHALAKEIFRCLHDFVEGVQCLPDELVLNFVTEGLVVAFCVPDLSLDCDLADLRIALLLVRRPESNPRPLSSSSYRVVSVFLCCGHCC